jgi:hypothetical protein
MTGIVEARRWRAWKGYKKTNGRSNVKFIESGKESGEESASATFREDANLA